MSDEERAGGCRDAGKSKAPPSVVVRRVFVEHEEHRLLRTPPLLPLRTKTATLHPETDDHARLCMEGEPLCVRERECVRRTKERAGKCRWRARKCVESDGWLQVTLGRSCSFLNTSCTASFSSPLGTVLLSPCHPQGNSTSQLSTPSAWTKPWPSMKSCCETQRNECVREQGQVSVLGSAGMSGNGQRLPTGHTLTQPVAASCAPTSIAILCQQHTSQTDPTCPSREGVRTSDNNPRHSLEEGNPYLPSSRALQQAQEHSGRKLSVPRPGSITDGHYRPFWSHSAPAGRYQDLGRRVVEHDMEDVATAVVAPHATSVFRYGSFARSTPTWTCSSSRCQLGQGRKGP